MKTKLSLIVSVFFTINVLSQNAPAHLKYFGYALVDMLWDDPHDAFTTTNYINEVDSFSNIAQLGVYDYTDNIISRVNLMNSKCVKPTVAIQAVFFTSVTDATSPTGVRLELFPDFVNRWHQFKTINQSILDSNHLF